MNKQDTSDKLDRLIAESPKERLPQRDLWTGIELAIVSGTQIEKSETEEASDKRTHWQTWTALAASICTVAVVAYISFAVSQFGTGTGVQGRELVANLSQSHEQQKQSLLISYEKAPALTDNWRQQLSDLEEAEKVIIKALETSPNNPALLRMLKNVYAQQLSLIERVHAPQWQQI
uniref:hypothetical protein n=1 Tax=Ningiella ruwaisensis TaxID=2364274 RepID=UPI00109F0FB3|nr:hypothetical protein [Ningiella ruwaisensis]